MQLVSSPRQTARGPAATRTLAAQGAGYKNGQKQVPGGPIGWPQGDGGIPPANGKPPGRWPIWLISWAAGGAASCLYLQSGPRWHRPRLKSAQLPSGTNLYAGAASRSWLYLLGVAFYFLFFIFYFLFCILYFVFCILYFLFLREQNLNKK